MSGELPESFEAGERLPLSEDERQAFGRMEWELEPFDDAKRPLPDEIEWGVPGAEPET